MRSAYAVRPGVATAYHQHVFVLGSNALSLAEFGSGKHTILLREQFEGKMHALEVASRYVEVAGCWCAGGYDVGVEAGRQLCHVYFLAEAKYYAFVFHQTQSAVDNEFIEFEIWYAVAQQSTGGFVLLKHGYAVAHLVQAIGSHQSGRT